MNVIENQAALGRISRKLAERDPMLNRIHGRLGAPPLWGRQPGLATLVHIVLEQQVSLASGRAAFAKVRACCGGRLSATRIIQLGEQGLRDKARLTRQKARYVFAIAETNRARRLNFRELESLPDDVVREKLMQINGIGIWTSDVYLMTALNRADILPLGDLALEVELAKLCKLSGRPNDAWILRRAEKWRPWRAAATRMIWHSYLDRLGRYDEI